MPEETILNAWGEPITEEDDPESNPYWVPPEERKEHYEDPDAKALLDPRSGDVSDDVPEPGDPE